MIRTRADDLAAALRDFVAGAEEESRLRAYQIARESMADGVGLLEVVADHQEALALVLSTSPQPEESVRWVRASSELLGESLGPFEMAQRGFRESNATLMRVNRDLEGQIVERRLAEDAARAAREEADTANRAKSEFLSRMSHELRTPLNAVLGFAQLLGTDELAPDQRESVDQIVRAGRHLLDLINEVLDIARIESGRLDVAVGPVPVDDVLREAVELVRPLAADRAIRLVEPPGRGDSRYVLADNKRLRQVLLNLLSNAIKYNREGGSVKASLRESPDARLSVVIADTGPGIAPDKLERLFDPFDRLGAEETGVEGTGLGLALSMGLVDAMGGRIEVESAVGAGSTFTVQLHLVSPESAEDGEGPTPAAPRARGVAAGGTVLCIEDNPANLALVERILRKRPEVTLRSAMRGLEGLELARVHRPDLILLDLQLPDTSGEEVLRALRADPATRGTPVLVLSADATLGRVEAMLAAGASGYLTKPLDVAELLERIDALLAGQVRSGATDTTGGGRP